MRLRKEKKTPEASRTVHAELLPSKRNQWKHCIDQRPSWITDTVFTAHLPGRKAFVNQVFTLTDKNNDMQTKRITKHI